MRFDKEYSDAIKALMDAVVAQDDPVAMDDIKTTFEKVVATKKRRKTKIDPILNDFMTMVQERGVKPGLGKVGAEELLVKLGVALRAVRLE